MRVVLVELVDDELGVGMVLGEDDGLAHPIPVRYLDASRH